MKLFSTKTHGILDYLTAGTLLVLPRMLGWSATTSTMVTGSALSTLGASLLTRYELGLFKVLPMRAHLTLDALNGLLFCAAPFLLPDEDQTVKGTLVGLGLFELVAALTTETEPSLQEQGSQLADQIAGSAERLRDSITDAAGELQERATGA